MSHPPTQAASHPPTLPATATGRVFTLEMLPAREGDCLLITWGEAHHPHRLLVDGGRRGTLPDLRDRLVALPEDERRLELLVVTHVDRDHIEGVLALLTHSDPPATFADVWFNGFHHLHNDRIETFGPVQGERLSGILRERGQPWNAAFAGRSVEAGRCPDPVRLPGGLTVRVLAPSRNELAAFIPLWERECRRAGLLVDAEASEPERDAPPGYEAFGAPDVAALASAAFEPDTSAANATSIVLLLEFAGRAVLLAADAHASTLTRALAPLATASPTGRYGISALKLPHHGSAHNVSTEFLQLLDCPVFLVSSNGSHHGHPHDEAVARVLTNAHGPHLVFNYCSPRTRPWDDDDLRDLAGYTTSYPPRNGFNAVDLLALPPLHG